jgi:nitroreductase
MKDLCEKVFAYRHACKLFDENNKIPKENLEFILNSGIKAASSFGMEPWKFLVVQDQRLKEKIRPYAWNQPQITTCSDLVIILAKIEELKPKHEYVKTMFSRRPLSQEKIDAYIELYGNHLKHTMSSDENIYCWSARQCYIALANMMNAAAAVGVDSCAIEGFEKENIENLLELNTSKYQLAVMLPLGYRVKEQPSQIRRSFDDVVEFI